LKKVVFMKDYIVGISGLGLSLYVFVASKAFQKIGLGISEDPAYYPRILAALMAMMSIGLLIGALKKRGKLQIRINKELLVNLSKFLVVLIAYILIMNPLGFIISTAMFSFSMIWLFGGKKKQAVISALPISLLIYFLFSYLLRVPLPKGILYFI